MNQLLNNPLLLIGTGTTLIVPLVFWAAYSRRGILVLLSVLFFLGSLSINTTWDDRLLPTWLLPLQANRTILCYVVAALLLLVGIVHAIRARSQWANALFFVFLAVGLYASALRAFHVDIADSVYSTIGTLLVVFGVSLAAGAFVSYESPSYRSLPWAITLAGVFWLGATGVQVLFDSSLVIGGKESRFMGLSGNPQKAALMLATAFTATLWLALNDTAKTRKLASAFLAIAFGVLLLLTGSRTGLGMVLLGSVICGLRRFKHAVLLLPLGVVIVLLAIFVTQRLFNVSASDAGLSRVTSLDNTRSASWIQLARTGSENWAAGVGPDDADASENSVLYGFASYGVGMGLLLVAASLTILWKTTRLVLCMIEKNYRMPAIADFIIAFLVMYFFLSLLEGVMIARIGFSLFVILPIGVFATHLIRSSTTPHVTHHSHDAVEYGYFDNYGLDFVGTSF